MSFENSYAHTLLLALDELCAAIFFNEPDITVSSMCWMVRNGKESPLKLYAWQRRALVLIGDGLEYFWPGHCAGARAADVLRSARARDLLDGDVAL